MLSDIFIAVLRFGFFVVVLGLLNVAMNLISKRFNKFMSRPVVEKTYAFLNIAVALALTIWVEVSDFRREKEMEEFYASEEGKRYLEEWDRWSDSLDREILEDDLKTFFMKQKIEISDEDLTTITDIAWESKEKKKK